MSTDKIYCGSGKAITTKYGELMKLSFSKTDLETMMANLNEKGWINVDLKEKMEKVEGKPTHYIQVDTWKAEPQTEQVKATIAEPEGDLPF